ncbi:NPC intracellular cholesterol transporter 2-like [Teleopsis dalmanni]|uniref:NPC intracellular cholesterol transporter 2-like n=1 Tax=Teleopsis dalmanni TaxID=139649 RepID=UPI0018CCD8FD|nr:NPC intracellular cholesterol transporter 2-like [Teleopsis dalmanni]XP_037956385.1 NPC intracellular cholesterol transporter 2-like [Teleopsis dalmanni]
MLRSILLITLVFALANATNVQKCKKGEPFPLSVDIKGCQEEPCDIVRGSTAVMDVHFVSPKDNVKKLTAKITATALGITTPYELPESEANVCKNLLNGASCPLDEGEDVIYQLNFYIDYIYPKIPVKVEVSLVDEDKESFACFAVDIKVK